MRWRKVDRTSRTLILYYYYYYTIHRIAHQNMHWVECRRFHVYQAKMRGKYANCLIVVCDISEFAFVFAEAGLMWSLWRLPTVRTCVGNAHIWMGIVCALRLSIENVPSANASRSIWCLAIRTMAAISWLCGRRHTRAWLTQGHGRSPLRYRIQLE